MDFDAIRSSTQLVAAQVFDAVFDAVDAVIDYVEAIYETITEETE